MDCFPKGGLVQSIHTWLQAAPVHAESHGLMEAASPQPHHLQKSREAVSENRQTKTLC